MKYPCWSLRSFLLAHVFLGSARLLQAESVVLSPVADTTLFETYPDNNLGRIDTLVAGTTSSGASNRAVIKFDVAGGIPSNATIQSVTLSLTVTRTIALGTNRFRIHRLQRDWGEGLGSDANTGASALTNEATWFARFFPDQLWSAPGAQATTDYLADPSAETDIFDARAYDFASTSNLVADVQFWRTNAAANFGWILICADEAMSPTSRRFASREAATDAPALTINYTVPERLHLDLAAAADTALFEYKPDYNLGGSELASGSIGVATNRSRALLRFDFTDGLPSNAVVTAASLRIYVTRVPQGAGAPTSNFDLHRLLKTWGEGNKIGMYGLPAEPGEATWFSRFYPDIPWSEPGAEAPDDYVSNASATQFIDSYGWWEFTNVVDDVHFWQTNAPLNHGWIMISQSEDIPRSARRFASREDPLLGPVLRLEYVEPPHIDSIEVSGGQVLLSFTALARNPYAIECREMLGIGNWMTCTNLPPLDTAGPVTVSVPWNRPYQFYRVSLSP